MKILLAGSPEIALAAFEEIINHFEVVGIVTQPDKKQGRGLKLQPTAVALLGKKYQIPVFKPEKISQIRAELAALKFDILVTFAFGQYIPSFILQMGKYLPVNIHGSLLPKYRGAAPIQRAILDGENEIGITLIEMVKAMDAGDMLFWAKKKILPDTTSGEAFKIISSLAKENIVSWLKAIEHKQFKKTKQVGNFTLAPKIAKSEGEITSNLTYEQALRKIYGFSPLPGAFMIINDKRLKIFDLQKIKHKQAQVIKLKDGLYYAYAYQWEGKKIINLTK